MRLLDLEVRAHQSINLATVLQLQSSAPIQDIPAQRLSGSKQLQKKADEVELSQPTPSFSRGLDPPPREVSIPADGCSVTDRVVVAGLPHSLPSPCRPTGCPMSRCASRKIKTFNAGWPHEGARRHRALLTDAILAELFFGDKNNVHCPIGRDWLTSRRTQPHRALSTVADLAELFLVTFVARTARRSVGVKPACTEASREIPPRPLGVGVVDNGWMGNPCLP